MLLAEDDDAVRGLVVEGLRAAGFAVIAAASAEDALARAVAHPGRIDVLAMDVVMPGLTGMELWRRLAAARPGTRTVFISGYPGDALAQAGLADSEAGFVPKPFSLDALVALVTSALAARPQKGKEGAP